MKSAKKMLNRPVETQSEKIGGALERADQGLQRITGNSFTGWCLPTYLKSCHRRPITGSDLFGLLFGFFVSQLNPASKGNANCLLGESSMKRHSLHLQNGSSLSLPLEFSDWSLPRLCKLGLDTLVKWSGKWALNGPARLGNLASLTVLPSPVVDSWQNPLQESLPSHGPRPFNRIFNSFLSRHPPPHGWNASAKESELPIRLRALLCRLELRSTWMEPPFSNVLWVVFSCTAFRR